MFRKKKGEAAAAAEEKLEISAPELPQLGAIHPSLMHFPITKSGVLGNGATVLQPEVAPESTMVDPGELITEGTVDDSEMKWGLFKLRQSQRTLERGRKMTAADVKPDEVGMGLEDLLREVKTPRARSTTPPPSSTPPPLSPVEINLMLNGGPDPEVKEATHEWAIAQRAALYAEAKLDRVGTADPAYAIPNEVLGSESGDQDISGSTRDVGPSRATSGELAATMDDNRTTKAMSFVMESNGTLKEQSPEVGLLSASVTDRKKSGRTSSLRRKHKRKSSSSKIEISAPTDFVHLDHKGDHTVDIKALPPVAQIEVKSPSPSQEHKRKNSKRGSKDASPPKLRPDISAPVGFQHLQHAANPEEAMFEDDELLGTDDHTRVGIGPARHIRSLSDGTLDWSLDIKKVAVAPSARWDDVVPEPTISLAPLSKDDSRRSRSSTSVTICIRCEPLPSAKIRFTRNGENVETRGQQYYSDNPPLVEARPGAPPIEIQAVALSPGLEASKTVKKFITQDMITATLQSSQALNRKATLTGTLTRRFSKTKLERKGSVSKVQISNPSGFTHVEHREKAGNTSQLLRGSVLLDANYDDILVDETPKAVVNAKSNDIDSALEQLEDQPSENSLPNDSSNRGWGAQDEDLPWGSQEDDMFAAGWGESDPTDEWTTLNLDQPALSDDYANALETALSDTENSIEPAYAEISLKPVANRGKQDNEPAYAEISLKSLLNKDKLTSEVVYTSVESNGDDKDVKAKDNPTEVYAEVRKGDQNASKQHKIQAAEIGANALLKQQGLEAETLEDQFGDAPKLEIKLKNSSPNWLLRGYSRAYIKDLAGLLMQQGEEGNFFVRDGVQSVANGYGLSVKVGNGMKKLLIVGTNEDEFTIKGSSLKFKSITALITLFTNEAHPMLGIKLREWQIPEIGGVKSPNRSNGVGDSKLSAGAASSNQLTRKPSRKLPATPNKPRGQRRGTSANSNSNGASENAAGEKLLTSGPSMNALADKVAEMLTHRNLEDAGGSAKGSELELLANKVAEKLLVRHS